MKRVFKECIILYVCAFFYSCLKIKSVLPNVGLVVFVDALTVVEETYSHIFSASLQMHPHLRE